MKKHFNIYKKQETTDALDNAISESDINMDSLVNNGQGMYSPESAVGMNEVETIKRETGTKLDMGTESDMEELLGGDERDPGAGRTMQDSEFDDIDAEV